MNNPSSQAIAQFHMQLHDWYAIHGRHTLPWRNTDDAYAIYLSEVMLQQTQVETVLKRFYFPFLEQFPTISALAQADVQEVLKAWEGLGYYTRARNLHAAARQAQPTLPSTPEELMKLPGIGRNTAHAVAAFAYRIPVPVMEANVKRVLCRIFAIKDVKENILWEKAELLLDRSEPYDYNQAMMDIGSMVCRKTNPACMICPANTICAGKVAPLEYPAPKQKKETPVRRKRVVIARDSLGRIYASPRDTRFLNGLYHFIEVDANERSIIFEGESHDFDRLTCIGNVSQAYSHFTLEAEIYLLNIPTQGTSNYWHNVEGIEALPWSGAEIKMLKSMNANVSCHSECNEESLA